MIILLTVIIRELAKQIVSILLETDFSKKWKSSMSFHLTLNLPYARVYVSQSQRLFCKSTINCKLTSSKVLISLDLKYSIHFYGKNVLVLSPSATCFLK